MLVRMETAEVVLMSELSVVVVETVEANFGAEKSCIIIGIIIFASLSPATIAAINRGIFSDDPSSSCIINIIIAAIIESLFTDWDWE